MKVTLAGLAIGLLLLSGTLQAQQAADDEEKKAAAKPAAPSDQELLRGLAGDSHSRLMALGNVGVRLWNAPEKFYPAVTACGDDPDVRVRRSAVMRIGQFMIWSPAEGKKQDPRAIEFMMDHSRDEDVRVRYNCVYFGLSVVTNKSDALLDRLLDLAVIHGQHPSLSLFSRIAWGCQTDSERLSRRIQHRIDTLDAGEVRQARMLALLHYRIHERFPDNLSRYPDTAECLITLRPTSAFVPKDEDEWRKGIAERLGKIAPIDRLEVGVVRGDYLGVLFVTGFANYADILHQLESSGAFESKFHGPLDDMKDDDRQRLMGNLAKAIGESGDAGAAFSESFRELYAQLGREYAHFDSKGIDWEAIGKEFLPRTEDLKTRTQFCRLCQELIARLEDSHAYLHKGKFAPADIAVPRYDPGFACLIDDQDRPVVYHVDAGSPAAAAGLEVGMVVTHVNDQPAGELISETMHVTKKYAGYSSDRYLRYHAAQWLARQMKRDTPVSIKAISADDQVHELEMKATMDVRYLPRLPVPIEGIPDSANVSWKRLEEGIGYIYVRRIRGDLPERLDAAVAELKDCDGLIIDVRGNSGGGFDAARAVRNFDPDDKEEPERPRYTGPIAVLIDARCISAGEGWVSWFRANDRGKFFGETTAGASARKKTIEILDGAYKVTYSVKAYKGFLDRPIERQGIQPDVPVRQQAKDLAQGIDTVLTAARQYLLAAE